jgi:hypothetical protein
MTNAEFAKTLDMPAEWQAKAAAFADAKGLSLAGRDVVAEYKESWVGSDGKRRPATCIFIVTADAALALALNAGRNFAPISTEFTSDGREWVDVWLDSTPPRACRVTFEVEGIESPVRVTHTLQEYTQGKLTATQRTMPALMLAKATMQLGLRRIAPQALAGLYSQEEAHAVDAATEADAEHGAAVAEVVNAPDAETSGGKLSRAEQFAARKAELVTVGKALRADCGDEAAERLAVIVNNMRTNAGLDLAAIKAAELKVILAAAKEIRAELEGRAAAEAATPEPAAAPEPAAPAADPAVEALQADLGAEFVI